MVSKCANPACSERFLYLHRGKLFHLNPTPEIEAADGDSLPALYERFWLCDQCCRKMTVVWGGTNARVVPLLAARVVHHSAVLDKAEVKKKPSRHGVWRRIARAMNPRSD
jgi:hypothetical protein